MCTRVVSVVELLVAPNRAMHPRRAMAHDAEAALSYSSVQLVRKETPSVLDAGAVVTLARLAPARETA
jgi:hypothetical protein